MEYNLYTVRDSQAEVAMQPTFFEQDAQAIKAFKNSVCKEDHFDGSPADYTLYKIGKFNDNTMELHAYEPQKIIGGLDAWNQRQADKRQLDLLNQEIAEIKEQA